MADLRIPAPLPVAGGAAPARTSEAVRAAQRAFFDAALSNAAPPPPLRPATATNSLQAAPLNTAASGATEAQSAPTRALRPGSLLDIRV